MGRPPYPGRDRYHQLRQAGASVTAAAKAVGVSRGAGHKWDKQLRSPGSIASLRRARRSTAYNQDMDTITVISTDHQISSRFLSVLERERIKDLQQSGASLRKIGAELGRPASTISREIARNSDPYGRYLPYGAQRLAVTRRARPKQPKLLEVSPLRDWVQERLGLQWSPAQISATLVKEFPDQLEMRVSHETIYQALYLQARGGLKKEVQTALRTGRARRKPQGQQRKPRQLGQEMIMISDRPAEIEERAVPGHWEGDLIMGAGNRSAIATLVERKSRFLMLCHLPTDHTAVSVAQALTQQMLTLPAHLRGSLTWVQGSEMAEHHKITLAAELPIYFCDPASPWQRGSNENTNGLLRQYFPKGSDLAVHGPEDLEHVAHLLNGRPRETLDWNTPAEKMKELILTY
ncbi:IS30 family transposase [Nesterenkonia populi]|uniref:IS30 family transposase n=1 Tax=Nesterenkonia populi TaxID=1591087 RepID=UPI003CCC52B6